MTTAAPPARSRPPARSSYDPAFALSFGLGVARLARVWHRYRVRGMEAIPEEPCLFVCNHSGVGVTDVLTIVGAWAERFRGERHAAGMMHKMFVNAPIIGPIARRFGAVEAHPDAARAAFARGMDVACFPGGDLDACRPFYDERKVVFGKRRGYVRIALERGVPVVPVATIGSHRTYTMLPGGSLVARITGMKTWARCERFPVVLGLYLAFVLDAFVVAGALPWWTTLLAAIAVILPNPVRVTTQVLPPIDLRAATAHVADEAERVEAAHALVHGAIARAVATMTHDAPYFDVSLQAEAGYARALPCDEGSQAA